uniref:Peptidase A2 domain-containing protein n=1 Tax=Strongyloides venezuelensis TaxID=75913 RepID=A0A0K0FSV4_STRVS
MNEVNNVDFSNSLDDNKVNDDYKVVYYCKLNDKKLTTRVVIENYNCQALLDTGANISLMSNKLYNKIKDKITIHPLPALFRIMDVQQQVTSILVSNNNFGTVDVIVETNILKNSKRLKNILFQLLDNNEVNTITMSDEESESSIKKLLDNYNILPKDDIIKPSKVIPEIEITVNDVKPVVMKNRPIPFTLFKTINSQVQEMIKSNIVETSSSPYNSAIVPIKKPDGSIRLCIDYRLVNQKIKYGDRPLPHITSMFYHMYKKKLFTRIDLFREYYQLRF